MHAIFQFRGGYGSDRHIWNRYYFSQVILGNRNTYLEAKRELDPPVWASKVRFLPFSYHRRTVCMRVEIYGCYWNGKFLQEGGRKPTGADFCLSADGIVSYSMPQGDKRGTDWEFFDATYDGHWDGDLLQRGLGLLTDGKVGPENFRMGYYERSKSVRNKKSNWTGTRLPLNFLAWSAVILELCVSKCHIVQVPARDYTNSSYISRSLDPPAEWWSIGLLIRIMVTRVHNRAVPADRISILFCISKLSAFRYNYLSLILNNWYFCRMY